MTIANLVARALEAPLVVREALRPLDAIVVLGAPLGPNDRLSAPLAERARAAAALWRAGGAPLVVATGGITRGASRAEADVLADALRAEGVPDVLVERASRSTAENALFTAELLRTPTVASSTAANGARSVWIVTQPFHGRRAAHLFRRAGLDAHVWHIEDSIEYRDRRRALRWLVREYGSWAALILRR